MFKKIFIAIAFLGNSMLFAQQGVLKIEVLDNVTEAPLELANVLVESAGIVAATRVTDEKGVITIKNLNSGQYDVKATYNGYSKKMITEVLVKNNETTYLTIKLTAAENMIKEFVFEDFFQEKYEKPLIDPNTSIKTTFLHSEIESSVFTEPNDFMATVAGAVQTKDGATPNFRGARTDGVVYIVDGERMYGTMGIPQGAIQQMSVTLGGIQAKYGDGTGAFIEIETMSGLVNPNSRSGK